MCRFSGMAARKHTSRRVVKFLLLSNHPKKKMVSRSITSNFTAAKVLMRAIMNKTTGDKQTKTHVVSLGKTTNLVDLFHGKSQ